MIKLFDFNATPRRATTLAVAAALMFTGVASAQSSASAGSNKDKDDNHGGYSLLDLSIFAGYQWFQIGQGSNAAVHAFRGSGAWGERISEEFSNYLSAEEGIQIGYNSLALRPLGAPALTTKSASAGGTLIYAAGVFNFAKRDAKYRPFVLIGPGYDFYKPPALNGIQAAPGSPSPLIFPAAAPREQGRTALVYGIGMKINQSPRLAWRLDLFGMRSGTPNYGLPNVASVPGTIYLPGGSHESSLTASVGITFRLRYREPIKAVAPPPPPPPAPKANVQVGAISGAHDVCAGENVRLTVTASGWLADQTPSYQWMIDGSPAPGGTAAAFSVPTAGASGAKSITVRVSAGGSTATSSAVTVRINPLTPPTLTFGISPSTVPYGTKIALAANGQGSACGGPVTIRYSGQGVSGTTLDTTALGFDMSNRLRRQTKTVTVTATATDQKNQTVSKTADVTVNLTAEVRRLDDIVFPMGSARVNNCAKRILLEELTPMLKNDPDAKVVLVGHRDTAEKGKANAKLDETRVINSAAVLSAGKGICPSLDLSRVLVNMVGTDQNDETKPALCGTSTNVKEKGGQSVKESDKRAQYRRVEIWYIPGGVDVPANLAAKAAPVKDIQAKGCPK